MGACCNRTFEHWNHCFKWLLVQVNMFVVIRRSFKHGNELALLYNKWGFFTERHWKWDWNQYYAEVFTPQWEWDVCKFPHPSLVCLKPVARHPTRQVGIYLHKLFVTVPVPAHSWWGVKTSVLYYGNYWFRSRSQCYSVKYTIDLTERYLYCITFWSFCLTDISRDIVWCSVQANNICDLPTFLNANPVMGCGPS